LFPSKVRCSYCLAPFTGIGSWLARAALDKHPSSHHPGFCNVCDHFAQAYGGGADVDMAMLFIDIRGSTQLSTRLSPRAFSQKIESLYAASTQIITAANGFVERLAGDEVIAYFGPGPTGDDYVEKVIRCGLEIVAATGHQGEDGPEIPLGRLRPHR
jgi:adenylate cyclase